MTSRMTPFEYVALKAAQMDDKDARRRIELSVGSELLAGGIDDPKTAVECVYAALARRMKKGDDPAYVSERVPNDFDIIAEKIAAHFTEDELRASILWDLGIPQQRDTGFAPSMDAARLAVAALDPQPCDVVLNAGGGRTVMESLFLASKNSAYYEMTNTDAERYMEAIRLSMLEFGSADFTNKLEPDCYDKVFLMPPLEYWSGRIGSDQQPDELFSDSNVSGGSLVWNKVAEMLRALKADGEMAVLVPQSCLMSPRDGKVRRFLTDAGYLRTVVALPGGMASTSGAASALLVLGRKPSKEMLLVDGAARGGTKRRADRAVRILEILDGLCGSGRLQTTVSVETIRDEQYDWMPSRYMVHTRFPSARPLGDLVKEMRRGSQRIHGIMGEYCTEDETNIRVMQLPDLRFGVLRFCDVRGQNLTQIPAGSGMHLIPNHAVVLSKVSGGRYSSAVAEIGQGMYLLATGNVYVLEPDEKELDPYFLQAFLASDEGQDTLRSASTGSHLLNLARHAMLRAKIPVPPLEMQHDIGEEYRKHAIRCIELNEVLEREVNAMRSVWQ